MTVGTAKVDTLLPIDTFAAIMGIHPMHFNQVYIDEAPPCGVVWLQYGWQADNCSSREEVARAIRSAEDSLEQYLGFSVAPKWFVNRNIPLENYVQLQVVLPKGYYITGGARRTLLLEEDATIVYDTEFVGSTYLERATITITSDLDPTEIAICYPGEDIDDWQIRPIKAVSNNDGTITITCNRHQLVKKPLIESFTSGSVIGTEDGNFLTQVDVYRIYNDPSQQVHLYHVPACCSSGCALCSFDVDTGCIRSTHPKESIVKISPGTWNQETQDFDYVCPSRNYYRVHTWFKAGWPLINNSMDTMWADAVSKLAVTRLENVLCPCPGVQKKVSWWTEDVSAAQRGGAHRIPNGLLNCPWGYTRGALHAYSIALKHRIAQGLTS